MTRPLSGIDITHAVVQLDGRTVCATFIFAHAAPADFQLTFNLADTTEPYCCASLGFRRTGRRLELGHGFVDANGVSRREPVPNSGAALRGTQLTISGTLPPPSRWQGRAYRMPARQNLAWSVTTGYFPSKYGPYFGDWLPRHEPIGQPAIRQRDGAIITPGRG